MSNGLAVSSLRRLAKGSLRLFVHLGDYGVVEAATISVAAVAAGVAIAAVMVAMLSEATR